MTATAKTTGAVNAPAAVLRGVLGPWIDYKSAAGRSHLSSTLEPLYNDADGRPHRGEARINEGVEGDPTACRAWALFEAPDGQLRPLLRGRLFSSVDAAKRACEAAFESIGPESVVRFEAALIDEDEDGGETDGIMLEALLARVDGDNSLNARIGIFGYTDDDGDIVEDDYIYEVLLFEGDKQLGSTWRGRGEVEDARVLARRLLLDELVDKADKAFEESGK